MAICGANALSKRNRNPHNIVKPADGSVTLAENKTDFAALLQERRRIIRLIKLRRQPIPSHAKPSNKSYDYLRLILLPASWEDHEK